MKETSSSIMMELSTERAEILETFRSRVSDIIEPPYDIDCFLVKWLNARNFDLQQAEDMFRNHMKWREDNNIEKMVANYKRNEFLQKYFPIGKIGYDRQGDMVLLVRSGATDIKGCLHSVDVTDIMNYFIAFMDKELMNLYERCKQLNRIATRGYIIIDIEGLAMKQILFKPSVDWAVQMFHLQNNHYPDTLKIGLIINSSKVFYAGYNTIKYVLPEETKQKFRFFSNHGWKELIFNNVDPSQIPESYGGTLQDGSGDPRCPRMVSLGGQIPEEYYRSSRVEKLISEGRVKCVNIARGSKSEVEVNVKVSGSILRWKVCIEANDIDFEIRHADCDENAIHKQKLTNYAAFHESSFICTRLGKYIMRFDNGASYFRGKQVYYSFEVEEPK